MYHRELFSEQARNTIGQAFRLANELNHSFMGSEHLLWALSLESGGLAAQALGGAGLDAPLLRELIEKYDGTGLSAGRKNIAMTPDTNRILELSKVHAEKLHQKQIGTAHLLLGILQEKESVASKLIAATGVDLVQLTQSALELFTENAMPEETEKKPRRGKTKNLDPYSRDLTKLARNGRLDPVIGRNGEIQRVVQILSRRTKNNPVLIGEPGVGKTAVAEGLAQRVVDGNAPENLTNKRIVSLDLAKMLAGTKYRGEFEERIKNAVEEVAQAEDVILFIDELHTLIGAGAAEGAMDAANIIKPALSRGEIQVIGATTLDEYRKHIEKDAALERRFQPVTVEEPAPEQAVEILLGLRGRYEEHHKLRITDEAVKAAVTLSARYISDRFLPDKAIDLIDEAASRVRTGNLTTPRQIKELEGKIAALGKDKEQAVANQEYESAAGLRDKQLLLQKRLEQDRARWEHEQAGSVGEEDVAAVVSAWTGVPVTMLTENESRRLLRMEEILHQRVIGQNEAVSSVSKAIRRGRVGLKDPKRPTGSFLFLGPTGVGKTELSKALAEALFGDENAMLRVDMSEYMERHTVAKLIGSPPGYVGYEEGGQLTEKVRRKPYSVILFDEIEKAHPDVFNLLLQIMEDGILTDSQGRRVDFRNTVIVMTSNIGARNITEKRKPLGFRDTREGDGGTTGIADLREAVMGDLRDTFKPEFLNRIDEVIVFHQLDRDNVRAIARNMLGGVQQRMAALDVRFSAEESAVDLLAKKGFDPAYGARPLRRVIQTAIEDAAAEKILDGSVRPGDRLIATDKNGKIELKRRQKPKPRQKSVAAKG